MKKNRILSSLFVIAAAGGSVAQADEITGHTFFYVRPPFQSEMPEKISFWRDRALARECGWGGAIQIVPFGGQSTRSKKLAEWFTFGNKQELIFAEAGLAGLADNPYLRDVEAVHFNIRTVDRNFRSVVSFRPRQTFYGAGFDWKQYLHPRDACEKKWWFEVSFPVEHVRNQMRLEETITQTGVPTSANVNTSVQEAFLGLKPFENVGIVVADPDTLITAITGTGWRYGKITSNKKDQRKTGVADVELKLGYDWLCDEYCHAEAYIGGMIPTGNRPDGEFVFEPIVGHNRQGAIMWGAGFGWEFWAECDRALTLEVNTNARYFFRNTQRRSFDVRNKPWSRYMLVYENAAAAAALTPTEGINIFTRDVRVKGRFAQNANAALVYTSCGFVGELGYNFYAKQKEGIKLKEEWEVGPAFVSIGTSGDGTEGTTINAINRASTIGENFGFDLSVAPAQNGATVAYSTARAIQASDLNLNSAAHTCALSHIVYGALGYHWDETCFPLFVGIGGSYEFAAVNSILQRWNIWGKIGVSI